MKSWGHSVREMISARGEDQPWRLDSVKIPMVLEETLPVRELHLSFHHNPKEVVAKGASPYVEH